MPATKADIAKKRAAQALERAALEKRELPALIKDCAEKEGSALVRGKVLGLKRCTFESRLKDPGEIKLDELAVFIAGGYCDQDYVIEKLCKYLTARKTEILLNK